MTLDPKALIAANKEYNASLDGKHFGATERIITAYLSTAPSGQAPLEGVKALEWRDRHKNPLRVNDLVAESVAGGYAIRPSAAGVTFRLFMPGIIYDDALVFSDVEAAKAAAQADYEARIRSALLPASAEPLRHDCAASGFHDHDGCNCTDAELLSRSAPPASAEPVAEERVRDIAEKAYGLLWRDISADQKANHARRLLLTVLDKDSQKRGIEFAISTYGPTSEAEILRIDERDPASPPASGAVEAGWQPLGDEYEQPPHDVPVLLCSPTSMSHPNGLIEARPFSTGRSGKGWSEYSQHSWATHWMPLPAAPTEGR